MIKPSDIKFISKIGVDTSFYFIKEKCMFLFETTPASMEWFDNWMHTYKDLKGLIIISTMYGATIDDSPYMKYIVKKFRDKFGRGFDIDYVYPKKGGRHDLKFTVKLNNFSKVEFNIIKDLRKKRADVCFTDEPSADFDIYYSGSSYGMDSSKLDTIPLTIPKITGKYFIVNLFNKYAFYNIKGTKREFFESMKNVISIDPMHVTLCGFPDIGTENYCENEINKTEVVGFAGRGTTNPVIFHFGEGKEILTHEH